MQWQAAMSGRAPPKSIKNKLTHLSFLRLLGTSTGAAVGFLAERCTRPKLGQRGGEGIKKVMSLCLPGLFLRADTQGWHKNGKVSMKCPAPL